MSQAGIVDFIGTHPEIATEFIANVGTAVPIANQLELLGETVAAGTNPFRSVASGNTVTYQAQISQAIAASDATRIGLSAFNSSDFTVDSNGFVSLSGGGQAIDSIATQTGINPIVPTVAGLVSINGGVVAAGSNPVRSNGTGVNTMDLEVQISQAVGGSDVTRIGLSNYNSTHFSVDANGFVSALSGGIYSWAVETGATRSLTVNQGVMGNRATAQTFTLPDTAAQGSIIRIVQIGAGLITIAQNAGETIHGTGFNTTTGVGGSLTTTAQYNAIELLCTTANTDWTVLSQTGTWTPV